jgi:hypothetical protein
MKKKILALMLMVSVVTISIFAGNQLRVLDQDGTQEGLNSNPIYVQIDEDTYKNVETNELCSIDELPEYCRLVGGDGQNDLQRNLMMNSYNQDNRRNDQQKRANTKSNSGSRNSGSSRNYQNR